MPLTGKGIHGNWWTQLRHKLSGNIKQRVTRSGLIFSAVTIVVGVAGFLTANNLLILVLAAMLATLLVSGFISRLGLAGLEVDLELPEHISAKNPAAARVRLHNHKKWMPSFSIRLEGSGESGFSESLYFPVIPGNAAVEETLSLCFSHRGQYREDAFVFSTRFPFGFTERRAHVEVERDIVVYPSIAAQPGFEDILAALEGDIASKIQGRGEDFHRLRPYEHNESARRVDWKATAHSGRLQVREFVRRERPTVEIVLDLDVPPDRKAWFENAVDCCAYLAWSMEERQSPFRFRTQLCDYLHPSEASVYDILRFLALVQPSSRTALLDLDEDDTLRIVFRANGSGANLPPS